MNLEFLYEKLVSYGTKIVLSLLVLIIGLYVIKRLTRFIERRFEKVNFDISLRPFLLSIINITFKILLVITIASMLGAEMTSFVALLGSAGLAVGLALQGSLSNFAGGVLLLILKPFKVGDYIEASGHSGTVKEIQIFYTILNTVDNKKVIIPNSILSNNSAINYSGNSTRRVDFKFGVGYEDDIFKVKEVLNKIVNENKLIFTEPKPQVVLGEHGDSSINFFVRVWCNTEDYWTIYYEIIEKVKLEFDKEGINIPYPQMDIHLKKDNQ